MRRATLGLLLLLVAVGPALADAAPDPEEVEAMALDRLQASGHACPSPRRFERLTPEDQARSVEWHVYAQRVLCGDGKRFLVSTYARRPRGRPFKHFVLPLP